MSPKIKKTLVEGTTSTYILEYKDYDRKVARSWKENMKIISAPINGIVKKTRRATLA